MVQCMADCIFRGLNLIRYCITGKWLPRLAIHSPLRLCFAVVVFCLCLAGPASRAPDAAVGRHASIGLALLASAEARERRNSSTTRPSVETEHERPEAPEQEIESSAERESTGGGAEFESEDRSSVEGVSAGRFGGTGIERDDDGREDGVPRTVAEMLRRITRPDKPKRSPKALAYNNLPRAENEIIAVDLSAKAADRARKLGFDVRGPSHLSTLHRNLTRLVPPSGMPAAQARDLLSQAQPGEQFAINQRYKIYQPARKDMAASATAAEPAHRGGCASERCFGSQIIRWSDAVRPCADRLRIGVIDTAVDHAHPAFSRAKINLGRFLPEGASEAPAWHGTGVLSVLAGDRDSGTPGLIPDSNFFLASVFFKDKKGEVATDTLSVLSALDWMGAFNVQIINMSFSGPKDELLEAAIEQMSRQGVLFVAAVGNDGPSAAPSYPAAYRPVVAVTAITKDKRNYPYANRGDRVDVAAPGVDIWAAVPNAEEGLHTGTSFAVPYVTAILAAAYRGDGRAQRKDEMLNALAIVDLGPAGRDPIYGRGLALAPAACGASDRTVASSSVLWTPVTQTSERQLDTATRLTSPSAGPADGQRRP
jgi:Subtilase family